MGYLGEFFGHLKAAFKAMIKSYKVDMGILLTIVHHEMPCATTYFYMQRSFALENM